MELKKGMICKHFKGSNLIEKNIYEIIAVNPTYTGTKQFEPVVVYSPLFQDGKTFVRELSDLTRELSLEEKELYNQEYMIQPLTDEELLIIQTDDYIENKNAYIEEKYGNKKGL